MAEIKRIVTENELLKERVEQLRNGCKELSSALDKIDSVIMPIEQIVADTKAVGGPVSPYSVDCDSQGVIDRVLALVCTLLEAHTEIKRLEAENSRTIPSVVIAAERSCAAADAFAAAEKVAEDERQGWYDERELSKDKQWCAGAIKASRRIRDAIHALIKE